MTENTCPCSKTSTTKTRRWRYTEITTLPGGQNLGELSDIEYFQKKLYRSLGVPESRIAGSGEGFNLGRSSEILRDEIKFTKFVGRMRKRFAHLFNDMLKTQLILKNIVTPEDWETLSDHIQYDFMYMIITSQNSKKLNYSTKD